MGLESSAESSSSGSSVVDRMRREWDERARENARYYVATAKTEWTDEEYFQSGRQNVANEILIDMQNVCQGKDPKQMSVLEIGCGSGRITRALAETFGQVHAVDISGEMIAQARQALADVPNAHVYQNSGADLRVLGDVRVDFAFSYIVFQHIPSREVIWNYTREVYRVLKPGCLFKFQVQGDSTIEMESGDTWLGVAFSQAEAAEMADACGFRLLTQYGSGTQYYWLWFIRKTWLRKSLDAVRSLARRLSGTRTT